MAESGRGAIKVGTGYVEIVPKVLQKDMQELRTKIVRELEKVGAVASKEMRSAIVKGMAGLPAEVAKQAKKAKELSEKQALDSKKTLTRIAKELTKQYGKEAADRFLQAQRLEKDKVKLVEKTSSATKKALRETVAAEEKAAKTSAQRWATAEKERAKAAKQREKDAKKARQVEETEAAKFARDELKRQKMLHDAYAENEKRKRLEAKKTHDDEIKWGKLLHQAYAENERRKRKEAEQTALAEKQWRRTVAQAYAENERRNQAALRETRRQEREAAKERVAEIKALALIQRDVLRSATTAHQDLIRDTRARISDLRRSIADSQTQASSYFKRVESGMKNMGKHFHEVGVAITEAGNILTTKFLAPLALAGTGLTAIGVQNADMRLLGQLGLSSAGVSKNVSAQQMFRIQQYAIDTPFSIDTMHEYQMKLIRSVAGADKSWFSTDNKTRSKAANKAAARTTDLIMAVGDSMARAGNLSPDMFKRAMYAIDMIMDMDRAPTKNVKQLAAASGMGANELANLLGFKNSTHMWKIIGTPAKDGGGVTGVQIADAFLNYWNPDKYTGRYKGKGSKGFAESMTDQTITGRLQQMRERATFELGNMFVKEGKDGTYRYTSKKDDGVGLGELLMGKRVATYGTKRDPLTGQTESVKTGYHTEGGILNQVQDMAVKYGPDVKQFLGIFLESISKFVGMVDQVTGWLKETGLDKVALQVGKFLAQWGPLILAAGLVTKLFGKLLKIGGSALGPARAAGRGATRAYDAVRSAPERARNTTQRWDARSNARARSRQDSADRGIISRRERRAAGRDARRDARATGQTRSEARQAGQRAARNAGVTRGEARVSARRAGRQAYRDTRTSQNSGDDRSLVRRIVDRTTGNDQRAQRNQIRDLEDQARNAEREVGRLREDLRQLNSQTMRQIADALSGRGNNSVSGAANNAGQSVGTVRTQVQQTNRATLGGLDSELKKVINSAKDAAGKLTHARNKVDGLNAGKADKVASEVRHLKTEAEEAGKHITSVNTRVGNLNGKSVKDVTTSVTHLKDAAEKAAKQIGDGAMSQSTSGRVENLKKRRLTEVIREFTKLHDGAEKAFKMIGQGTGATSLAGRIGLLNNRRVTDLKKSVDDLAKALKKAKDEGDGLDGALDRIGRKSPGGGGSGSSGASKKPKKRARGGTMRATDVMPGYAPWVDNIPAILSPGESVLRPEVTNAIGEERINAWNALAVRGKISRHARGSGGKFNLQDIKNLISLQNIAPIGSAMAATMTMDATSDPLGGPVQGGILRTGDHSAHYGGSAAADKFRGMYDWMTHDIYSLLKKAPSGIGQIAGILGGTLNPIIAEYFWDDVWKGSGNIVSRGKTYLGDVFSMKTLGKVWDNLWGGVKDSAGSIWDVVTDPFGAFRDAVRDIGSVVSGSYNNIIGMVRTVKEIYDSPKAYAGRVYDNFMEDAKEAMPNLEGLFDFGKGSSVGIPNIPDLAKMIVEPGAGKGAQRWAPVASQALAMLGLPPSALSTVLHRIGVESGGNPNIVNNWDSNAKMGTPSVGLMQVIGPTFKRWAGPFAGTGPFLYGTSVNPLANIYAGLNYASHRYGSKWQSVLSGNKGYAMGTHSASPGLALVGEKGRELVMFGGGERVFNNGETEGMLNGKKYEIHVHEARTEPTPQAVMRALQTAEALYATL